MRRFGAIIAAGVLAATACSDGATDPSVGVSPTTTNVVTTTAPVATTRQAVVATTTVPGTTNLGPSITYDPGTPRRGGEVIIAAADEPQTLNPFAPGGQDPIVAVIAQAHLSGVFDIDPDSLELTPELVNRLPSVSNGGVVVNDDGSMDVTWEVRPEARWSDGAPVSGADLDFTLRFQEASSECSELGVPAPSLPSIESTVVGDKSLTARFPVASLQHELMFRWVVPSHAVAESDFCLDWNATMWPASGPFVFVDWDREGEERTIHLTRNEHYWRTDGAGQQLPYLDAVVFRFVSGTEELIAGFSTRQFDVISPQAPVAKLPVERWEESGADVQIVPGLLWEHLNFQFGPNNRNADSLNRYIEFRRAIVHAVDRRALLSDAGYRDTEVMDGVLSRFSGAGTQPRVFYEHDLEEARRLLGAACQQAGRDCAASPPRLVYSTTSNGEFRPAVAEQVAAQLAAIGIEVVLDLEDSQRFFGETVEGGTWDLGSWAWGGASGSAAIVEFFDRFDPAAPLSDSLNVYNWGTPGSTVAGAESVLQFAILLDRMRSTVDAAEVITLARQAEALLADQVVVIPLGAHPVVGAVWADEIQGYRMNPSAAGHTWNIERWYRVGE